MLGSWFTKPVICRNGAAEDAYVLVVAELCVYDVSARLLEYDHSRQLFLLCVHTFPKYL